MKGMSVAIPYSVLTKLIKPGFAVPMSKWGNRIKGTTQGTVRRDQRRGRKKNASARPMEINKAEGGFKPVTTRRRLVSVTINSFGRLTYFQVTGNEFRPEFEKESDNFTTHSQLLDVTDELNGSAEFMDNRERSENYKVLSVALTIDYNRIPQAGDRVSKLMLATETDRVQAKSQLEMKRENNTMWLAMASNGIKNYNTRVAITNTKPENLTWQNSQYTWPANWSIRVADADKTTLTRMNDETSFTLASWKLSVQVVFRLTDVASSVTMKKAPSLTTALQRIEELEQKIDELEAK